MVYVRQDRLPALKEYKYSGVDHSLTSKYILKPFYTNVVIKMFPMSMAPNLITLTGFMFVVANLLTLLWYNPTLDQDCPSWVYYSWAAGLFLYQTFDAVDGSQARRTHQSGPLGELFDHGVDALNTSLEVLIFAASQNMGQGWMTVGILFSSLLTFYVQTWDEYHTKTLTLGIVNGPVEGVLILVGVYALTGYLGGASFWQQSMLRTLGVPASPSIPAALYDLSFTQWYMVQGALVLVFNTVESARNMITAHLVKLDFPYWNVLGLPLAFGVGDALGPLLQERTGFGWPSALGDDVYQVAFMFLMLGMAVGVYGSFVVDVIVTICDYLDIWCLTIKHPWVEGQEANGDAKGKKVQ
uniref:diacylglycerol cholinephosphotransferase n=1 Tax=Colletotrichum fructicola (strain Nara gc5) TaxID=1213859 RepID=L2FNW6_COLFN